MVTKKILDALFAEFGLFGADAAAGVESPSCAETLEEERLPGIDPARFTDADVERFMAAVYRNQS